MGDQPSELYLLRTTVKIVNKFVTYNRVSMDELRKLIQSTHQTVKGIHTDRTRLKNLNRLTSRQKKNSISPEAIQCFECGRKFKYLKHHLKNKHEMDVHEYRRKWRLDSSYPMTAPNSSKKRSKIASKIWVRRKGASQQ